MREAAVSRLLPASLVLAVFLLGPATAAPFPEPDRVPSSYVERERVRLMLFSVAVHDRKGRPVVDLEAKDFRLLEGGVPKPIEVFGTEGDLPITLVFLLDLSGTMGFDSRLDRAKRGIRTLLSTLGADDRFGLIGFADEQVRWIADLGSDPRRFETRLDVQYPLGRTALFDALAVTPRLVDEHVVGRRAIVLITDGADNASDRSLADAIERARRTPVPIYVLQFETLPEGLRPPSTEPGLREVAAETGGRHFPIVQTRDIDLAVARLQSELRHQYLIGFHASEGHETRTFRRVEIKTRSRRFRVRTRTGYFDRP